MFKSQKRHGPKKQKIKSKRAGYFASENKILLLDKIMNRIRSHNKAFMSGVVWFYTSLASEEYCTISYKVPTSFYFSRNDKWSHRILKDASQAFLNRPLEEEFWRTRLTNSEDNQLLKSGRLKNFVGFKSITIKSLKTKEDNDQKSHEEKSTQYEAICTFPCNSTKKEKIDYIIASLMPLKL